MKHRLSLDDMRNASGDLCADVDTRKTKRTKNKNKDKSTISASQPSEFIDDVINAVVGDSAESPESSESDVGKSSSSTQTESSDFIDEDASLLQLMQRELKQLKAAVGTLTSKIDQLSKSLLSNSQVKATSSLLSRPTLLFHPFQPTQLLQQPQLKINPWIVGMLQTLPSTQSLQCTSTSASESKEQITLL